MEGGGLDMLKGDGGGRCVCRCRFDGGKCGYGIGGGMARRLFQNYCNSL